MSAIEHKYIVELDNGLVTVMPFDMVAFEAASDAVEFYEDYFGFDHEKNWDVVTVNVTHRITKVSRMVKLMVLQNPLEPQIELEALGELWHVIATDALNRYKPLWDVDDIPF